jgi:outer membrane protease
MLIFTFGAEAKSDYVFSASASTGFLYGQPEEIVYKPDRDTYLSELLWDVKPLFYWGLAVNFAQENPLENFGFFTNLSIKFGIPAATGSIEDRDWLSDHLTNFSKHDNFTQNALLFDFSAGISMPIVSRFALKFYASISFMDFSWKGMDGYRTYESEKWEKKYFSGEVISYKQQWAIFGLGISCYFPFATYFAFNASFAASPLVYCAAHDTHFYRSIDFYDYVSGGFFLEPQGEFVFSPLKKLSLSLSFSYRLMKGAKGTSYWRNSTSSTLYQEGYAGAAYSAMDAGFSIKVKF